MTKPRSNSRRFVNAAWALLIFQLIASAGAVGVTGVAAFHVRDLMRSQQQAVGSVQEAVATQEGAPPPAEALPTNTAPVAPAVPTNEGAGTLTLAEDMRGNIDATLSDPDGVSATPRIQWMRNGAPVPGVSGSTYSIRYEDSQSAVSARADYVDGHGFSESVVSQPVQIGVIIP